MLVVVLSTKEAECEINTQENPMLARRLMNISLLPPRMALAQKGDGLCARANFYRAARHPGLDVA
jgi:hypothetical protein